MVEASSEPEAAALSSSLSRIKASSKKSRYFCVITLLVVDGLRRQWWTAHQTSGSRQWITSLLIFWRASHKSRRCLPQQAQQQQQQQYVVLEGRQQKDNFNSVGKCSVFSLRGLMAAAYSCYTSLPVAALPEALECPSPKAY